MRREFKGFFVIKQIEKPWLCSVLLKRTQDAVRARKKCSEEHETWSSVSPHFLNVSQQNIEQLGLLYLLNRESKRQGTRGNEERDSHFTLASRLPPLAWILLLTGYLHQSNYLCCRWVLFSEQQLADKMRPLGLNWAWNLASEVYCGILCSWPEHTRRVIDFSSRDDESQKQHLQQKYLRVNARCFSISVAYYISKIKWLNIFIAPLIFYISFVCLRCSFSLH